MKQKSALPFASVIIPVFNDSARLKECLNKLMAQDYPRDRFEIIVVDNGSRNPPLEIQSEFENCCLLHESKPGSYAARNLGVQHSKGEILAFTDSDCLPCPQWLSSGVEKLRSSGSQKIGSLGGKIVVFPKDETSPKTPEVYDCILGLNQENNVKRLHFAATANMLVTRDVFQLNGPFDCQLKSGGDSEWGQRLKEHDLGIEFAEKAVIRHPARDSIQGLMTQKRRHAGGRTMLDKQPKNLKRLLQLSITFLKNLAPNPKILFKILSCNKYSLWMRIKTVGLSCLLHYTKFFELIKTRLGGSVERR